ncbi:MAG: peptide chain release factor 1 [Gemmatimonadetes bacterium]|jgi:peptide chain release factor 1|nr:peptide chain release factor 1 [Gemmatimonadota bacterium]MBT6147020.1 peptide chain release factor 1 [Gemmatimonadota bacterium]MBT7861827.1 peptide chain release factor 1 [Gemmatimonadota bacterium]
MSTTLQRLEAIEQRYEEITQRLSDPEVARQPTEYQRLAREEGDLKEVVVVAAAYRDGATRREEAQQIIAEGDDAELVELAQAELAELDEQMTGLEQEARRLLIPRDPNDSRNAIVEIRSGAGGDEAGLFAADLHRLYARHAERHGWNLEQLSSSLNPSGGFKEVIFMISGAGVFGRLKFESGVHRVQRVPKTETSGRIHTSAASVAVLAEAEDVDVEIAPEDLDIDVYRSSGPGGQSVNTTDSAVRITHRPSGLVVSCQDEKSQLKNKNKAMKVLRARLLDLHKAEQDAKLSQERREQIGSGDRSAKIRTYNYPQGRVTDHRVGVTLYQLEEVLDGAIDSFVDELAIAEQERLLALGD